MRHVMVQVWLSLAGRCVGWLWGCREVCRVEVGGDISATMQLRQHYWIVVASLMLDTQRVPVQIVSVCSWCFAWSLRSPSVTMRCQASSWERNGMFHLSDVYRRSKRDDWHVWLGLLRWYLVRDEASSVVWCQDCESLFWDVWIVDSSGGKSDRMVSEDLCCRTIYCKLTRL